MWRWMMSKRQVNGYVFNQELTRIRQGCGSIRGALRQLKTNPGPQTRSLLIADAAMALSVIQEAVVEIERIAQAQGRAQG